MYILLFGAFAAIAFVSALIGKSASEETLAYITIAEILAIVGYVAYVRIQPKPWGEGVEFASITPLTVLTYAIPAFLLSTTTMWVAYSVT